MKVLILAAGFGTRMQPFTNEHPKPLVPIHSTPLLFYTLSFLKSQGLTDIIINLHHHGDQIVDALKPFENDFNITYSKEDSILGTGGAIKKIMPLVEDELLVINGDIVVDFDLKSLLKNVNQENLAHLFLYNHPQKQNYGLIYHQDSQVTGILEDPQNHSNADMFSGIHVIQKNKIEPLLKPFSDNQKFCIVRDIYMPALKNGTHLGATEINGFWQVCDSLDDVKSLEESKQIQKLNYQAL